MSNSEYEYECMRAELLGLKKPERVEFERNHAQLESEILASEGDQIGRVSGGLDELNAVLESTKKKLTRYQSFHNKFGKLFGKTSKSLPTTANSTSSNSEENLRVKTGHSQPTARSRDSQMYRSDMNFEEYQRQNDKLDSLLNKAERAELSLNRNNKLIRKLVNK